MKQSIAITTVIFYDQYEDFQLLSEILHPHFPTPVGVAMINDVSDWTFKHPPEKLLLIFATEDITKAQGYLEQLAANEQSKAMLSLPHLCYLLCSRQYRKEAYKLCSEGLFEDYASINPLYDHLHFLLSVQTMAEKLEQMVENQRLQQTLDQLHQDNKVELKGVKNDHHGEAPIRDLLDVHRQISDYLAEIFSELKQQQIESATLNLLSQLEKSANKANKGHNPLETPINKAKRQDTQSAKEATDNKASLISIFTESNIKKLPQPKIMVVDDQEFIRQVIGTILRPKGFEVDSAANGSEALQRVRLRKPDLILLDIDMPKMNGTKVLSMLKAHKELSKIPVIMLTSHTEKNHFKQCLMLGAKDYIVKPTNAEILISKIRKYVAKPF